MRANGLKEIQVKSELLLFYKEMVSKTNTQQEENQMVCFRSYILPDNKTDYRDGKTHLTSVLKCILF